MKGLFRFAPTYANTPANESGSVEPFAPSLHPWKPMDPYKNPSETSWLLEKVDAGNNHATSTMPEGDSWCRNTINRHMFGVCTDLVVNRDTSRLLGHNCRRDTMVLHDHSAFLFTYNNMHLDTSHFVVVCMDLPSKYNAQYQCAI